MIQRFPGFCSGPAVCFFVFASPDGFGEEENCDQQPGHSKRREEHHGGFRQRTEVCRSARTGNADLILVHAKAKEEEFVAKGFAYVPESFETERLSFMYNYFVLCGPEEDPAKVADAATSAM